MARFNPDEDRTPDVGDEVVVSVQQAAGRTTLFPDQVVALTGPKFVELVLLREEIIVRSQRGQVMHAKDDEVHVQFQPHNVRPEQFDIGHVRMDNAQALDLAMTILAGAIQGSGVKPELIIERLHAMTASST